MTTELDTKKPIPKKRKRRKSGVKDWLRAIFWSVLIVIIVKWLIIEPFTIPTPSMEGSLLRGDYLFVSKVHYGARTPTTLLQVPLTHRTFWGTDIPSYLEWPQLPDIRFNFPPFAWSNIKRNDVIVFNYPPDEDLPIDMKTYYVKRCVAVAGDTLEIKKGQVFINHRAQKSPSGVQYQYQVYADHDIDKGTFDEYGIQDYNKVSKIGYSVRATENQIQKLKSLSFVYKIEKQIEEPKQRNGAVFPQNNSFDWNADNFGPMLIPKKGLKVAMTRQNVILYKEIIEKYEGQENVATRQGKLFIDGQEVPRYTFKNDYYFGMGDNRSISADSRYWGFIPKNHIIGKAWFIWFSINPNDSGFFSRIRWERIFKGI